MIKNCLNAQFKRSSHETLAQLFKSYCTTFYGSQSWLLCNRSVDELCPKYNRAIRILLNLPFQTHRNILHLLISSVPLKNQLCSRFMKMYKAMSMSKNSTICFVTELFKRDCRSIISRNIIACMKNEMHKWFDAHVVSIVSVIKDLIRCRNQNFQIPIFAPHDIDFIILDLCTN